MARIWNKYKLNTSLEKKVFVAMSGGVDSSVAAAILKKNGYRVTGVFMKPWSPNLYGNDLCLWKEDRQDALKAASQIGIPFETWDFSREYKKLVADYMISEYRLGNTPNPDIACNKEIKFGLFFDRAIKEGADYIATGHYARVKKVTGIFSRKEEFKLLAGTDSNKDQSYFLWTLNQNQLSKTLFPIGEYRKDKVRALAKKFNLLNATKKDSQGVCFIGPLNMKDFLLTEIEPKKGTILNISGDAIGEHDGVWYYTIGQRHGLNIDNGQGPYYVVSKDVDTNTITVGSEEDLYSESAKASSIHWIRPISLPRKIEARIRYRSEITKAFLNENLEIKFNTKQRAVSKGQSIVFYRGPEVLGGGIIE